jgi:hypothetical protein
MTAGTEAPVSRRWLRAALLCGIAYVLIGLVTAALARGAGSGQMRQVWRLAAWLVSAALFAAQIWYERFQLGSAPRRTAGHAALAVALGGFVLAAAAAAHSLGAGSGRLGAHIIALVAWPVLLAVPAFLVAWAAAAALALKRAP